MEKNKQNKTFLNIIFENVEKIRELYIKKINQILLNIIIFNIIKGKNKKTIINLENIMDNRIRNKENIKKLSLYKINFFPLYCFLIILINPILAENINIKKINHDSDFIIKLKIKSAAKVNIINGGYIPNKVYINGINSTIDKSGNIRFTDGFNLIYNVTLEYNKIRKNFDKMFQNINNLIEVDLSNINTSEVSSMRAMFLNCENLKYINFTNVDTSSVNNMASMFEGCSSLQSMDLSNFQTNKVYYMDSMFKNCYLLTSLNLSSFNTFNLRKLDEMFSGCKSLKSLDLLSFVTYRISNMDSLFLSCYSLTSLNINFFTQHVESMKDMFMNCSSLTSLDFSRFETSSLKNLNNMFYGCSSLISLNLSNFVTSKVVNMENMFYECYSLRTLVLSKFDTIKVQKMGYMFYKCRALISLNLSSFNFDNKNMEYFFYGCNSLTNIIFPKTKILPNKIVNIFSNCYSLTTLDLSNFNLTLINNTDFLFRNCSSLISLDLSNIDTHSIISMKNMFYNCKSLETINFTNFITSSVESFNSMFNFCTSLISLDLSSFDTSSVYDMTSTFSNCNKLAKINLSSFDTSYVYSMDSMFYECNSLTSLDLSNFNTEFVSEMNKMFYGCKKLISLDLSYFNTQNVIDTNYMFYGCSNLNYINFYYFSEFIPNFQDLFLGTSDNLVLVINDESSELLIPELTLKQCMINNSSFTFNINEKKIIYKNRKCIDDCISNEIYKYEFEGFCYEQCPKGSHSIEHNHYLCEINVYECFDDYPFLIIEDNICTNECSPKDFFNNICTMNNLNNQGYPILINNIINGIQGGILDEFLEKVLNEKVDIIKFENNILYQLTSTFNQNNKEYKNISVIEFGEYRNIIKDKYDLTENEILLILKTEQYFDGFLIPLIDYEIFLAESKEKLNFSDCNDKYIISISIPVLINENILFKYEPNSSFYNDLCNTYRTEEGTDIIISDRQSEFNDNNKSLCPKNCIYKGYNFNNKTSNCLCQSKNRIFFSEINSDELLFKFSITKKLTNFDIFKCYSLLFSKKGLIKNIGNYISLVVIIVYIISGICFYRKGFDKICDQINIILDNKIVGDSTTFDYKIELKDESKENSSDLFSKKDKISDNNNDLTKSKFDSENNLKQNKVNNNRYNQLKEDNLIIFYELNNISYKEALDKDKRTFIQYYTSLLKEKHILISIFNVNNSCNVYIIKICILFFSFVLNLVINTIFFNDSLLHQIYVDKGIYNFNYNIPRIIYSIIIFSIIILLIKKLSLYENYLLEIKREKNKYNLKGKVLTILKCLIIKFVCFFVFGIILLILFWYYLSSFCAVYNNTQIYLIKNSLISYFVSILYPFIIYLFPVIFRIPALKGSGPCLYRISQIIQIIC